MQFPINIAGIEPRQPEVIKLPLDKYPVVIVDTQYTENSKKTGTLLTFSLRITGGQYAGTEVPYRVNAMHSEPTTQAIGRQELAAILWATVRRDSINDTRELYNLPFIAKIGPTDDGGKYNEVKGIYMANGNPVSRMQADPNPAPTPPPPPPPPPPPTATPIPTPWQQPQGVPQPFPPPPPPQYPGLGLQGPAATPPWVK